MWKKTGLLLFFVFSWILASLAQQSGRIYFRDGSVLEIAKFTELRSELYYYQRTFQNRLTNRTSVDFIREYPVEKIKEIDLRYEKGRASGSFFYQLIIEGVAADGTSYRKKIKTWDWLEMSTPGSGSSKDLKITFFTNKRRPDFLKIEFDYR